MDLILETWNMLIKSELETSLVFGTFNQTPVLGITLTGRTG